MDIIKKKPEDWTSENIANFWNWQSRHVSRSENYFTAVLSPGIIRFLKKEKLLKGKILDYGCGSGHLLELLGKEKMIECYGLDFSADSIAETQRRTKNSPNIKQLILADRLPAPFEGNMFDAITFIETIEHLPDEILYRTLDELYRILKPGGKIFITTPFNEDLDKHMNFCPFCKTEFHHMQHMQSFTVERLNQVMQQHGFTVEFCRNIDIEKFKLGEIKFFIKKIMMSVAENLGVKEKRREKAPNLIAIVSKL